MKKITADLTSLLAATHGRFIGIEFFKLDGSLRKLNGRVRGIRQINGRPYVTLTTPQGDFKSLYAPRITALNVDRVRISVRSAA